jgi:hypothetical protein
LGVSALWPPASVTVHLKAAASMEARATDVVKVVVALFGLSIVQGCAPPSARLQV